MTDEAGVRNTTPLMDECLRRIADEFQENSSEDEGIVSIVIGVLIHRGLINEIGLELLKGNGESE